MSVNKKNSQIGIASCEIAALLVAVEEVAEIQISGKKFGAIRRQLVLTQQEFAEALKMSLSNVRRIERAEITGIGQKFVRAIAELKKQSPESMLQFLSAANGHAPASPAPSAPAGEGAAAHLAYRQLSDIEKLSELELAKLTRDSLRRFLADLAPSQYSTARDKMKTLKDALVLAEAQVKRLEKVGLDKNNEEKSA